MSSAATLGALVEEGVNALPFNPGLSADALLEGPLRVGFAAPLAPAGFTVAAFWPDFLPPDFLAGLVLSSVALLADAAFLASAAAFCGAAVASAIFDEPRADRPSADLAEVSLRLGLLPAAAFLAAFFTEVFALEVLFALDVGFDIPALFLAPLESREVASAAAFAEDGLALTEV